jgi:hypothetical protein
MSLSQKRDIDITKIPVNRSLLREWVETFCPDSIEEFRNALLWRLDEGLFIKIKIRGKDQDGYCQHGMNVIECHCWEWCGLAPTCPQINKEGQRYALKLIGERKWGKV